MTLLQYKYSSITRELTLTTFILRGIARCFQLSRLTMPKPQEKRDYRFSTFKFEDSGEQARPKKPLCAVACSKYWLQETGVSTVVAA